MKQGCEHALDCSDSPGERKGSLAGLFLVRLDDPATVLSGDPREVMLSLVAALAGFTEVGVGGSVAGEAAFHDSALANECGAPSSVSVKHPPQSMSAGDVWNSGPRSSARARRSRRVSGVVSPPLRSRRMAVG